MIKPSALLSEVDQVIRDRIEAKEVIPATWVTRVVVERHPHIRGQDADWYRFCAYETVRDAVRQCLRRLKPDPKGETDEQLLLPGFERLQKAYLVSRNEEQVGVPIELLTDDENGAKVTELRRMAAGCLEHAAELKRYHAERKAAEKRIA